MKKNLMMMGLFCMGMLTMTTSCGDDDDNDGPDDPTKVEISDVEYDAILSQYVNSVVVPTYSDLLARNEALRLSVVSFTTSPSNDAFSAVCDAWLNAREPWETSEAFLFGPVADKGLDPNMDSWPLDQAAIVQILNSQKWSELEWSGDFDEESEEIGAAQNVRGFHTLEFLCFKDGKPRTVTAAALSSAPEDIEYSSADGSAWGNYMIHVANLLQKDASDLFNYWSKSYDGGQSYARQFLAHNGGQGFQSAINCVEQIIDGCVDIASEVGSAKIGEPYDLYVDGKTKEALYAVESWYSWHSRDDYTNNIYSIRNAYYGSRDGRVNANSLSALVAKYNPSLDSQVKNAIQTAADAIQSIPQPFRSNIACSESEAAMDACSNLENLLKNTLKPYLVSHTK